MAEFAHNTRAHSGIKNSPFQLVYGYEPQFTILPSRSVTVPAADQRMEELEEVWKEARAMLEVSADRMKQHYDAYVRETRPFRVRELVWLEATNISITRTRKLADRRLGPFKVLECRGNLNYRLELPPTMRIHDVFHKDLLSAYTPDEIEGRTQPAPPPVVVDGDKEYVVDLIMDAKRIRGRLHFLVHWKGYSSAHDFWEPLEHVQHAAEALEDFYQECPDALR